LSLPRPAARLRSSVRTASAHVVDDQRFAPPGFPANIDDQNKNAAFLSDYALGLYEVTDLHRKGRTA
jgi:hypothetical protein